MVGMEKAEIPSKIYGLEVTVEGGELSSVSEVGRKIWKTVERLHYRARTGLRCEHCDDVNLEGKPLGEIVTVNQHSKWILPSPGVRGVVVLGEHP